MISNKTCLSSFTICEDVIEEICSPKLKMKHLLRTQITHKNPIYEDVKLGSLHSHGTTCVKERLFILGINRLI